VEKIYFECELCGRNENEVVLLKYPINAIYKDIHNDMDDESIDAVICIQCLEKDIKENYKHDKLK
jgi:hypothetical protein